MTLPLATAPFFSGPSLTFSAAGLPQGLAIDPATGVIDGTPVQVETRAVTVTAANAAGTAQQAFTWTIVEAVAAPGQVTGLAASPEDGAVALSWTAPADNGAAITGYVIERRIAGGAFTVLAGGTGPATAFTDTGLANGTLHEYRVAATNSAGTGPVSAIAGATPQAGGAALAVLAFAHGETGSVNQAVSTFTGLATAPGDVILAVTHRGGADNNQVTGVTIAGQPGVLVGRQFVQGQTKQEQSVWRANVSGSTADVAVTTAANTARVGVALWSVGAADTAGIGFAAVTGTGTPDLSAALDAPAGGLVLAQATAIGGGASFAWTGLGGRFQAEASASYWHAGADGAFASAVPGQAVTAAFGGTFNNTILTLVAVGPV